ncbi:DUF6056 family protein [Clostridium sp. D53t1_180928_C8]|uniref:DUF3329 domain-containing protein n=1 Tax=Clostridium sp. D53t1_180928_C8 TaxID=2787101 RepID=UPI0018A9020B|nr:DUF6056 family protein [Clostridium sp. D53t1_180928_C8]
MIYKKNKVLIISTFIIMSILFYVLNCYTPLYVDDYSYSFSFMDGSKISSINEILLSQKAHYLNMNGRSVVHTIAQFFLCYQKIFFNLFNTISFLGLVIIIYFYSYGTLKKIELKWILIIFLILWGITPNFGQSYLWITGASNYLYGILIVLIYLIPFRIINKDNEHKNNSIIFKALFTIFYLIFGILAGWTNENTSVALICISILYLITFKLKKIKLKVWMFSGLIGNLIGLSIMILAPGQQSRLKNAGGIGGTLSLLRRGVFISIDLMKYLTPIIIFLAILLIYYYYANRKKMQLIEMIDNLYIGIIFFIGSLASIYSMVVSPSFPERAWSGPIVLVIITIGNIYSKLKFDKKSQTFVLLTLSILYLFFCTSYIEAVLKLRQTRASFDYRVSQIISQKEDNIYDINIPTIMGYSKYDCYTGFGDLSNDSNEWPNTAIAKYYGVNSINKE